MERADRPTLVGLAEQVSLLVMYAVKRTGTLRVSRDGELEGLDLHEHGTAAYHVELGTGTTSSTLVGVGSVRDGNGDRGARPVVPAAQAERR